MFKQIYIVLLFASYDTLQRKQHKNKYIIIDLYKDINEQIKEKREKTSKKLSNEKIKAIKSTNKKKPKQES